LSFHYEVAVINSAIPPARNTTVAFFVLSDRALFHFRSVESMCLHPAAL